MSLKLKEMINKKTLINKQIMDYKNKINNLEIDRKKLEKDLWKTCNHKWGPKESYDDLCNRQCYICGLYNNHYIYS